MLKVQKLHPDAKLPTVAHPGSDLGFDLYANEDVVLYPGVATPVSTGIAATFGFKSSDDNYKFGLVIKDRSSMAAKGIHTSAGVVDAGYTGELKVIMTYTVKQDEQGPRYQLRKGEKIAQMLPQEVFTSAAIVEVESLADTARGTGGFGSTGA